MPPDRPTVVVADPIDESALDLLRQGPFEVVDATRGTDALDAALPEAWAILVRSRTRIDRGRIERAPKLRYIARAGVGVDTIDVEAATARGVRVVNAATAATVSVAELTVALILLVVRGLLPGILATRAGRWDRSAHGHELAGRSVGFVGYGRIARAVAERLRPFGVSMAAYDPYLAGPVDGTPLVGFEELLERSDIVSLHAALTPQNRHLLDDGAFARLRAGAYLVNVARGALVDEAALRRALDSGRLAGAALDVYEVEPPTDRALLEHPRVIPTPHLGASTVEGQARAGRAVAEELLRAFRNEPLLGLVNPEVTPR